MAVYLTPANGKYTSIRVCEHCDKCPTGGSLLCITFYKLHRLLRSYYLPDPRYRGTCKQTVYMWKDQGIHIHKRCVVYAHAVLHGVNSNFHFLRLSLSLSLSLLSPTPSASVWATRACRPPSSKGSLVHIIILTPRQIPRYNNIIITRFRRRHACVVFFLSDFFFATHVIIIFTITRIQVNIIIMRSGYGSESVHVVLD